MRKLKLKSRKAQLLELACWGKKSYCYWLLRQWWREIPRERVYTVRTR